jgi:hypothetical protein
MNKRITFYGRTIELILEAIDYKHVAKYIRKKLDEYSFYIQKKRDGSYIFYYEAQPNDGVPSGYYACEFSFDETE